MSEKARQASRLSNEINQSLTLAVDQLGRFLQDEKFWASARLVEIVTELSSLPAKAQQIEELFVCERRRGFCTCPNNTCCDGKDGPHCKETGKRWAECRCDYCVSPDTLCLASGKKSGWCQCEHCRESVPLMVLDGGDK